MTDPNRTLDLLPEDQRRGLAQLLTRRAGQNRKYPLSLPQQRLWFLDQLEPGNLAFNLAVGLRLKGNLHQNAIRSSIQQIVNRHEVLRTRFDVEDGEPIQLVVPELVVELPVTDLSDRASHSRESQLYALATEEVRARFDLHSGPPFRVKLFRLCADEHVLVCTLHHIVSDAWSMGVFVRELRLLYQGFAVEQPSSLRDLAIQYGDYAQWQRGSLSSELLADQIDYWRKRLSCAPASLDLPTDRPRPPEQTFEGASQTVPIPKELVHDLRVSAYSQKATLFMIMLATFKVLIHRYTGSKDIVVGVPIAGRSRLELEDLIGFFVNTLVLRTDLSHNPRFCDLLAQVRKAALEAFARADVPFERLVEVLQPPRNLSYNPIFQVMFSVVKAAVQCQQFGALQAAPYAISSGASSLDLSVNLIESVDEHWWLQVEYNTALFNHERISRMLGHYVTLLRSVAAQPESRISESPMLGEEERQRVLGTFSQGPLQLEQNLCIHQFFERTAARSPEATALVCEATRLSYRDLNARANQLARHLVRRGTGPEIPVGIFVERSADMLVGILGILKAGGCYVPIDPTDPKVRVGQILASVHPPVLLTQVSLLDRIPETTAKIICLDRDWSAVATESAETPSTSVRPNHLAYVLFTSGSTGVPKGVAIEHRSASTLIRWAQTAFCAHELTGTLFSSSICFDLSVFEIFVPLSVGGKIILAANALALPSLPAAEEVTIVNTVPSVMHELLNMGAVPGSVHVINLAGETLTRQLVEAIYERTKVQKVYNLYGPTESTTYSTCSLVKRGEEVTLGQPIANTRVFILDSQRQLVPIGVTGELYLSGDGLARGYYERPDLTAERFIRSPFGQQDDARMYRTGDLCRFLQDGRVQYVGRVDDQVKIRGFRVELAEIESVLARHPAVRRCVVTAIEADPGNRLVAYIVPVSVQGISLGELRGFVKESLPEYMVPSSLVLLDELPLTARGKVDRRALSKPDLLPLRTGAEVEARDPLELILLRIWQRVLGVTRIGITDNFFDLGGHSLLAARLMSQLRKVIGREIPLSTLFRGPTVESLAEIIREGREWMPDPLLMEVQAGNRGPVFFVIAPPGFDTLGYALLARRMGAEQPVYKIQSSAPVSDQLWYTAEEQRRMALEYIPAMRTVQPEGPYYLGAQCLGVQIAEQMVLELEAQGQEVGLLVIIDTWVLQNHQIRWLARLDSHYRHFRSVARMPLAAQFAFCREAVAKRVRRIFQQTPVPSEPWEQVYWPGKGFRPRQFRAPVLLFKSPKQPYFCVRDPEMGWGTRSTAGVEVVLVNASHEEMLREPYAGIIGARVADVLRRVNDRAAGDGATRRQHSVVSVSGS
jgi:amino acid adenylation domain-containing protein